MTSRPVDHTATAGPPKIRDHKWVANRYTPGLLVLTNPDPSRSEKVIGNAGGLVRAKEFEEVPKKADGQNGIFIPYNLNNVSLYVQVPYDPKIESNSNFPMLQSDGGRLKRVLETEQPALVYIPADQYRERYSFFPERLDNEDEARGSKGVIKRGTLSKKDSSAMALKIVKQLSR